MTPDILASCAALDRVDSLDELALLGQLADALEEAGHPIAPAFRASSAVWPRRRECIHQRGWMHVLDLARWADPYRCLSKEERLSKAAALRLMADMEDDAAGCRLHSGEMSRLLAGHLEAAHA